MAEAAPARLSFAGMVLDFDARSLTSASGGDVPLTPSEFGLLSTFLRGAGRALSRDHLLQAVAGREAEAFDRSIDVLVGRLRRKIEVDPKAPRLILTVPGMGYRFAEHPTPFSDGRAASGGERVRAGSTLAGSSAVRQPERRSGAGLFCRRHGRGDHDRALTGSLVLCHRSQFELHLQGPSGRCEAGGPRAWRALRSGGQCAQGR